MQFKTTVIYHFTSTRPAKILKSWTMPYVERMESKGRFHSQLVQYKSESPSGKSQILSNEIEHANILPMDLALPLQICPSNSIVYMHLEMTENIHGSTNNNSPMLEITNMFIKNKMDKRIIYSQSRLLYFNKNERITGVVPKVVMIM